MTALYIFAAIRRYGVAEWIIDAIVAAALLIGLPLALLFFGDAPTIYEV